MKSLEYGVVVWKQLGVTTDSEEVDLFQEQTCPVEKSTPCTNKSRTMANTRMPMHNA